MHPEDIKASIRKRFGSVFAFEDANELPRKSVSDFLRGRANQRVKDAIAKTLSPEQSELSDSSGDLAPAHRQNAVVR
jgi:lambda repressor-like predicted transcriptional regulator